MRNWSWHGALHGGDTPVCFSTNDLACSLKLGVGKGNGTFHFFFFFFFWGRILVTARQCRWACQVPPTSCHGFWAWVCQSAYVLCAWGICTNYPCNIAFLASLSLCPLTAGLLYSTQLYHFCRVECEKRESGNFIIITSHFCNLYAMRTLRACSYNQVCRNHVRCFTNSWGDGSSSGGYGFPCR